jgi:hypothetical protein
MIDIKQVIKDAELEVSKERSEKAKRALVTKLRALEGAKQVVRNIEAEIEDLKASIADGSFN